MDKIFDRLSSLIRSLMAEEVGSRPSRPSDPDLADAMDELDEFLKTGKSPEPDAEPTGRSRSPGARPSAVPEDIVRAYRNLELSPTASMEQVRVAYRKLIRVYHPDRHADDPEKMRVATEITQKITESFIKIREYRRAAP